ncbi:MAG: F0F1 ATP synthase subunit B [Lentimicrobiaceae bacterium]|nr:F0F1 ATP synthase subunit B [Lentimicrobiaceae bacterium]
MELVMPGLGLIFWMTLVFGILLFVLAKFAWKPIMNGIRQREDNIRNSLEAAEQAHKDMLKLKAGNEELLQQAKNERDSMLAEARKMQETIIEEAKIKANEETNRLIEAARVSIEMEKKAAISELKGQLAEISVEISEKLLKRELEPANKQKQLIDQMLKEIDFN